MCTFCVKIRKLVENSDYLTNNALYSVFWLNIELICDKYCYIVSNIAILCPILTRYVIKSKKCPNLAHFRIGEIISYCENIVLI